MDDTLKICCTVNSRHVIYLKAWSTKYNILCHSQTAHKRSFAFHFRTLQQWRWSPGKIVVRSTFFAFSISTLRERTISILFSENIFSVVQQFNLRKIFIITIYMLHIMRIYFCFLCVKCFLDFFALQEERRLYVTSLIVEFTNILPLSQYFKIVYYCILGYANIILPEDGVVILQKY